jgi:tetratricopeptide (TPR) repeat protein
MKRLIQVCILLGFLYFFSIRQVLCQEINLDSLIQTSKKQLPDSAKIQTLLIISNEYRYFAHDTALIYANQALDLAIKLNKPIPLAEVYNTLGVIYDELGGVQQSIEYYVKAVKINEKIGDKRKIAANYTNMGMVYYDQSVDSLALEYFNKALKIGQEIKNNRLIFSNLMNLGNIEFNRKKYQISLSYYNQAYQLAQQMEDSQRRKALLLNNLAINYEKFNNYSYAFKYGLEALEISRETKNKNLEAETLNNLGLFYIKLRNFKYAEQMLDQARLIALQLPYRKFLLDNYEYSTEFYSATEDFKKALAYQKKHQILSDSLSNDEKHQQITNSHIIYQVEKRKEENIKLQAEREIFKKDSELNSQRLQTQRFINFAISTGLIMLLIILYFLYRQIREKQKTNVALMQKNDIQQKLNREIKALNDSLEEKIRERTLKLEQQNKTLLEYSFLNSHRIRKYVASILGLVYILKEEDISVEDQISYIQHIQFCAQEMDKIIFQINEGLEVSINQSTN